MIYKNETLRIVPFERGKHMTEEYRSWMNDSEVTKFNSWGLFPYTSAQMDDFVKTIEYGNSSKIIWAIEKHLGAEGGGYWFHIGNCSIQSINWINRSAELAIVLGRNRGEGHGKKAFEWMMEHGFYKLNLNRLWTGTAAINIGMNKICKSLGMKQEAAWEDGMWLNGQFETINGYGITRKHWDELR